MAVEIKYVVVRKGEEKMTFASKKEADAYDKMLDMAEVFSDWLSVAPLTLDEQHYEALGLYLAENKEVLQHILRTSKLPDSGESTEEPTCESELQPDAGDSMSTESEVVRPVKTTRAGKAA
ncbi:YebG family protein [Erwinia tracheiphila]|uniref:DNA damage-inducible SOS regulon protein n=1 Tax=Erwinia tracheiphila TaxID=65700 RepID=A0A0M2K8U3_9GAMM|nr:YebG family protein [Erwinia tracheiphila]AXF75668.1 hypothetical protein AV903_05450 [Erwinia tracheiphila]EOS93255.1 hypothetical protein ETR_20158 [Erwinia tracheiphila PSU-1]KKF35805.1 hypothetical protein SY86_10800 [Erwinia tracheiphila]UIA81785.1 YebG family protein [Erwinia tracheiphila]UIA86079.1 YebG family protein [Erwinia tracheiphila]